MDIVIRPMQQADLPRVTDIEAAGQRYPWTFQIFSDCLRVQYPCWVVEIKGQVEAFLLVQFILDECHILNIAVAPALQRQGIAEQLITHLLQVARQTGVKSLFLEVRESNTAAINLYKKWGFTELNRRKDYYPSDQGREDAIIFSRVL